MPEREKPGRAQMPLRMSESLRDQIEKAAREHGVSMNAEIVARLRRSFDRERAGQLEAKVDAIMTALEEQGLDVKRGTKR